MSNTSSNASPKKLGRASALALSSVAALAMLAGCAQSAPEKSAQSSPSADATQSSQTSTNGEPVVVVSSYPLAFLAEEVAGDDAVVKDMSANAGDAHHLELSPAQVSEISKADFALYIGDGFQSAMEQAIKNTGVDSVDVLTAVPADELIPGDPHVWLNPLIAADIADEIAAKLSEVNPADAAEYQENAAELRAELEAQDAEYQTALAACSGQTLLTSHEAFGYLAKQYGLEQVGVLGVDPDAEPSPARIAEVQKMIQDKGITTLFVEPKGGHAHEEEEEHGHEDEGDHHDEADHDHEEDDHGHVHLSEEQQTAISKALGIPALVLDPMEIQVDPEHDFLTVMHMNLHALQDGMSCVVDIH